MVNALKFIILTPSNILVGGVRKSEAQQSGSSLGSLHRLQDPRILPELLFTAKLNQLFDDGSLLGHIVQSNAFDENGRRRTKH